MKGKYSASQVAGWSPRDSASIARRTRCRFSSCKSLTSMPYTRRRNEPPSILGNDCQCYPEEGFERHHSHVDLGPYLAGIIQEPTEQLMGIRTLAWLVRGNHGGVNLLPEHAAMFSPLLAVRHMREKILEPDPVEPSNVNPGRQEQYCALTKAPARNWACSRSWTIACQRGR